MSALCITNCRIVNPGAKPSHSVTVTIAEGKINTVGGRAPRGAELINAAGRYLVPGFIEAHIQGAGGAVVLDGTPEAQQTVSATQARYGVTGYLATTVYRPGGDNHHLAVIAEAMMKPASGHRPSDLRRRPSASSRSTHVARTHR